MIDDSTLDLTHKFLIALPGMDGGIFERSVIFICHHDSHGAMGLIVNKPKGDLSLSTMLAQIGIEGDVKTANSHILNGGPVDINRGFVLHSGETPLKSTATAMGDDIFLSSSRSALESLVTDDAPHKALLFIGYAGWDGGQIEREIQDNVWIIAQSDSDIIFSQNHEGKWTRAIRSLGIAPEQLSSIGGRA